MSSFVFSLCHGEVQAIARAGLAMSKASTETWVTCNEVQSSSPLICICIFFLKLNILG